MFLNKYYIYDSPRVQNLLRKGVEIVYLDRQGNVTQRRIIIRSIRDGIVKATCLYESKSLETNSH